MIKASDLRIGNLVNTFSDKSFITVKGIKHDEDGYVGYFIEYESGTIALKIYDDFFPVVGIPLTPEWLERCGFKFGVNENGTYYIDLNSIDRQLDIILSGNEFYPQLIQAPELSSEDFQVISLDKIDYLHQLQNLYFILTGNELEIKELA